MPEAVPSPKNDAYNTIDLIVLAASIFTLGINYSDITSSFFSTVLVLIISPFLRKTHLLITQANQIYKNKLHLYVNVAECVLMLVMVIICSFGMFGVLGIYKPDGEATGKVVVRVVEGYVFLSEKGFDLRVCFVILFSIVGIKLFNAVYEGFIIK